MKRLITLLGVAILCGALSTLGFAGSTSKGRLPSYLKGPRPETGSFLNHVAVNLKEVVGQVKGDPVVADRLMRHFHMSKTELVAYLGTLHMAKLEKDGAYWVYNVHDDGVIRARVFSLAKGTLVYSGPDGKPVLRHKCANPMTRGPKGGDVGENDSAMSSEEAETRSVAEDVSASMDAMVMDVPLEPGTPAEVVYSAPVTPEDTPQIEKLTIISTGGSNIFGFISLGMLGLVGAIGSQSHTTPVPEPGTILATALGFGYMALRSRRLIVTQRENRRP